jgi:hypothetical protein
LNELGNGRYWHFYDMLRERMDFRYRRRSGREADTGWELTSAASAREVPLEGRHGWLVKNDRETVLFKCFAGGSADDTLTELRARWLWDDRETPAASPLKPRALFE